MPKSTFVGVKLSLVGPVSVEVKYDITSLDDFMMMKGLLDDFAEPKLDTKGKEVPEPKRT
ncbi:hypothetical protein [Flyfo microvirus Tbat2_151]|nr:hypothetical protein [Flyfo microvirus Tbat2_151]